MITVHVACPVCHQTIEYVHHEDDAWGSISMWDYGIVELTGHDRGVLAEHKNSHTGAEWAKVQAQQGERLAKLGAKALEMFGGE